MLTVWYKLAGLKGSQSAQTGQNCMVALSSHLCQILHVWRFDIHHIEALVGVIQMPQIDTQVITRDEGLLITADGNGIYMIRVCISKHTPTSRLHDLLHTSDLHKGV